MSFRELTMIDVREVLRRMQAGHSARQLARDGVVDRKTASRYFEAAHSCGVGLRHRRRVGAVVGNAGLPVSAFTMPWAYVIMAGTWFGSLRDARER